MRECWGIRGGGGMSGLALRGTGAARCESGPARGLPDARGTRHRGRPHRAAPVPGPARIECRICWFRCRAQRALNVASGSRRALSVASGSPGAGPSAH